MAWADLDYTIEIPDQPCWSQSMDRGLGLVVWGGDLTSLRVASTAVAPPVSRPRPLASRPLAGSCRSQTSWGAESPAPLWAPPRMLLLPEPRPFLRQRLLCRGLFFCFCNLWFSGPCRFCSLSSWRMPPIGSLLITLFGIGLPSSRLSSPLVARGPRVPKGTGFQGPQVLEEAWNAEALVFPLHFSWQWLINQFRLSGRTLLKS